MTDRSFKIYQGEDLSPVTDLTAEDANAMGVHIRWEEAEFGTRAFRGESTNSNVPIVDPNGVTGNELSLPSGFSRVSLASKNVLELVHGSNVMWRGRMATKDYSRGDQMVNRYREAGTYLEDINIDLRGIVVHNWARPAETDVARLQSLIATYLSGTPRKTTKINGSNLLNAGSNTVNLPAHTYTQSSTAEVIEQVAQAAGKTYHLLPRRRTTDAHTAELFYDGNDAILEQCPYRITDRPEEVKASPSHYFFPIWNVGPASTENGQELISGVWLFYGQESYVHVSDATQANLYSHWEEVIYDGDIETEAEATARAQAVLFARKYEERTYNVTIGPLTDGQVGSIRAGQHINIKARGIPDADDAFANRKIAQLKLTTPAPGMWFAHLQLERPLRAGAHGTGLPVGPKPATPGTPTGPGTPDTIAIQWHFGTDNLDDDTSTYGWFKGGGTSAWSSSDGGIAATGGAGSGGVLSSALFPASAATEYLVTARQRNRWGLNPTDGVVLVMRFYDSGNTLIGSAVGSPAAIALNSWVNVSLQTTSPVGTTQAQLVAARGPTGASGALAHDIDDVVVSLVGTGSPGTPGTPGPNPDTIGDPDCYAGCGHTHHVVRDTAPALTDDADALYPVDTFWIHVDDVDSPTQVFGTYLSVDSTPDAAVWVQQAAGPGHTHDADAPTIAISGSASDITNDSSHNGFPGAVIMPDGRVLLTYRKGTDHATTPDGSIRQKLGTVGADGTISWGSESTLVANPGGSLDVRGGPSLSVIGERIWFVYETWDGNNTLAGRPSYVIYSDDNAATWSSPVQITGHGFSGVMVAGGPVVLAPDRTTLLLPVYGYDSVGDTTAKVVRSSDDFATQSATTIATGTIGDGSNWTEPVITVLDNGEMLCSIRETTDEDIYSSRSLDVDGSAWTTAALDHDGYGLPTTFQAYSGALIRIYRQTTTEDAVFRVSYDRGLTWGDETDLESTGTTMDYATAVQVGTTIHVIYSLKAADTNADIVTRPLTDITDVRYNVGRSSGSTAASDLTTRWEPVIFDGEIVLFDGDIVMHEVPI